MTIGSSLALVSLLALSGCTASDPEPSASPDTQASETPVVPSTTPTPSQTAAPATVKLTITGSKFVLVAADKSFTREIPFSAKPATALKALTLAIGSSPTKSTTKGITCNPSHSEAKWGKQLTLSWGNDLRRAAGAKFVLDANSATIGSGIAVETSKGFSVGDSSVDLIAGQPDAESFVNGDASNGWTDVFFDITAGSKNDSDHWQGAYAFAKANKGDITRITSPLLYIAAINQCS
jgi:hypothetical protein